MQTAISIFVQLHGHTSDQTKVSKQELAFYRDLKIFNITPSLKQHSFYKPYKRQRLRSVHSMCVL